MDAVDKERVVFVVDIVDCVVDYMVVDPAEEHKVVVEVHKVVDPAEEHKVVEVMYKVADSADEHKVVQIAVAEQVQIALIEGMTVDVEREEEVDLH